MIHYTGVGSRTVPDHIKEYILRLSRILDNNGYILRSGGADGSDTLFETYSTKKEIFLPWKGFNDNPSTYTSPSAEAIALANQFHPRYSSLSAAAKNLHARNVHQVLGYDLKTPSKFVICYTKDGAEKAADTSKDTGGTGTAIRVASFYGIPVYNLQNLSIFYNLDNLLLDIQKHL